MSLNEDEEVDLILVLVLLVRGEGMLRVKRWQMGGYIKFLGTLYGRDKDYEVAPCRPGQTAEKRRWGLVIRGLTTRYSVTKTCDIQPSRWPSPRFTTSTLRRGTNDARDFVMFPNAFISMHCSLSSL